MVQGPSWREYERSLQDRKKHIRNPRPCGLGYRKEPFRLRLRYKTLLILHQNLIPMDARQRFESTAKNHVCQLAGVAEVTVGDASAGQLATKVLTKNVG